MSDVTPDAARAALESVRRGRRSVARQIAVPNWYWWSVAAGWVLLGSLSDLAVPWLTLAATVAFGAVHSAIAPRVIDGRHGSRRLSVGADVAGRHVAAWVIAGLVGLVAVTVAAALALDADGARHPGIGASVFVAALVVLGGPLLVSRLRAAAERATDRAPDPAPGRAPDGGR